MLEITRISGNKREGKLNRIVESRAPKSGDKSREVIFF
jgi:hypothetical protein